MTEKQTPKHEIRAGSIKVSVWENKAKKGDREFTSYNVTFQRGYKDKQDEWQNTTSLNTSDVPKLISCMQRAYVWIISQKHTAEEEQA